MSETRKNQKKRSREITYICVSSSDVVFSCRSCVGSVGIHCRASSMNAWPSCEAANDFFRATLTCFGK